MIVYVWSRRNPYVRYTFFGLFTFQAPYLPWILVLLAILFNGSIIGDLVGEKDIFGLASFVPLCVYVHIVCFHAWRLCLLYQLSISRFCTGIAAGHVYYFLVDVFPQKPGGFPIIRTPQFM